VVLGGEASPEAMQRMHNVLQRSFGNLGESVLFGSLDPLYLSQVGNPKTTRDFISMPDCIPDESKAS